MTTRSPAHEGLDNSGQAPYCCAEYACGRVVRRIVRTECSDSRRGGENDWPASPFRRHGCPSFAGTCLCTIDCPRPIGRNCTGHILVFLAEKQFEGCAGLEITDEVRITIAAHACILLLHRGTDYYPGLSSILVYPHAYAVPARDWLPGGMVVEGMDVRQGESWHHGAVVLSWDSVRRSAADRQGRRQRRAA